MNIWQALFLGLVQGLSEFLPISSSGHLVLFETVFGLEAEASSNMFFDVMLHFGTLIAVVIAFRQDILVLWRAFVEMFRRGDPHKKRDFAKRRMILMILIATMPLLLIMPLRDWLEQARAYPWIVGIALVVTAILLLVSDLVRKGKKTEKDAKFVDALLVGLMQAVAVTPGLSRSGSTISAGIFVGFERGFAVRFSFLLSLPAVVGATLLELADVVKEGIDTAIILPCLAGMAVAAVSGFFAIKLVRYIANKGKFGWFALYCALAGAATIVFSLI